jgi:hypothetical protein
VAFCLGEPQGALADQVSLELCDDREHVEQQPANGVIGIVQRAGDLQAHLSAGEFVDDVPRIGQRAGEAVELGDHERVAGAAGGERLAEPGTLAVASRQSVVEVDSLEGDAELGESVSLGRSRGALPFRFGRLIWPRCGTWWGQCERPFLPFAQER